MSYENAVILDLAADLLEPEGKWIQDAYATDSEGNSVSDDRSRAACFCVLGAIGYASGGDPDCEPYYAVKAFRDAMGFHSVSVIPVWNDDLARTQAEVVSALRMAAAKERVSLS